MFAKDTRTEKLLDSWGFTWEYSNSVKFKDLLPKWETHNEGRSKVKMESAISNYLQRTKAGSMPPGPILHSSPKGFDPLDGVQRLAMAQHLGWSTFNAYVVTCEDKSLLMAFRIMANSLLAGHPESAEWTKRTAVEKLIINGKMSTEDVARLGGWKVKDIQDEKTAQLWGFKIRCNGGPALPKNFLLALDKHSSLATLDKAAAPIVEFIEDLRHCQFATEEAIPYMAELFSEPLPKNGSLHKVFTEKLENFRNNPEISTRLYGRHGNPQDYGTRLASSMKRVLTIASEIASGKKQVYHIDEYFRIWNQVHKQLSLMQKIHNRKR